MSNFSVELRQVTGGWTRGRPVVNDLNEAWTTSGLVRVDGPNGSGKSTLVELFSGYLRPMSGDVYVAGHPAHSRSAIRQRVICRSAIAVFPEMTVMDHLNLTCALRGLPRSPVLAWAERYGLSPWLYEKARNLSTGSRRKLWIAMCWDPRVPICIMDEPFQGLDTDSVANLCDDLNDLAGERLVIVVAHDWPDRLVPTGTLHLGVPNAHEQPYPSAADHARLDVLNG